MWDKSTCACLPLDAAQTEKYDSRCNCFSNILNRALPTLVVDHQPGACIKEEFSKKNLHSTQRTMP